MKPAADGADAVCAALHAVTHWRVDGTFGAGLAPWVARGGLAGELAGTQARTVCAAAGFRPQALFVLSTLLPAALCAPGPGRQAFVEGLRTRGPAAPFAGIVTAYLCAGWGFLLRHLALHTVLERVALCIVDIDLADLAWNRDHPVIGRSGFGFTTVLAELPRRYLAPPRCSGPHPRGGFNEFALELRAQQQRLGARRCFLPFVREPAAALLGRLALPGTLAPNLHGELGHCFGADPFIGLAEAVGGGAPGGPVLLGALGFNGYACFGSVRPPSATAVHRSSLDGDAARLRAVAGASAPGAGRAARASSPRPSSFDTSLGVCA